MTAGDGAGAAGSGTRRRGWGRGLGAAPTGLEVTGRQRRRHLLAGRLHPPGKFAPLLRWGGGGEDGTPGPVGGGGGGARGCLGAVAQTHLLA